MTPSEELLSAYLDDELDGPERADVERRLATDPSWQETLEKLREVRAWMHELPAIVPSKPKSIVEMLATQKYEPSDIVIQSASAPQFNAGPSSKRWMMSLAAASAVLLVTTLWWISRDPNSMIALSPAPTSPAPGVGAPAAGAPTSGAPAKRQLNPQVTADENMADDFGTSAPLPMSKSVAKAAVTTGDASDAGDASGSASGSAVDHDLVRPAEMAVGSALAEESNRRLGREKSAAADGPGGMGGLGGRVLGQPGDEPAMAAVALPDPGPANEPASSAPAGAAAAMPVPAPAAIESIAGGGNAGGGSGGSAVQTDNIPFGAPAMRGSGKPGGNAAGGMALEGEPVADNGASLALGDLGSRGAGDLRDGSLAFKSEQPLAITRILSESPVPRFDFFSLTPYASSSATLAETFALSEKDANDQNKKSPEAGVPEAGVPESAATTIFGDVVHLRVPSEAFADLQQAIVDGSIAMRDVAINNEVAPAAELLGRRRSLPGNESASEKETTGALPTEQAVAAKPIWLLEVSAESYENLRKRWSDRGFDISEILDEEKLGLKLIPTSEEIRGLTLKRSDSSDGAGGSLGERPEAKQTPRGGATEAGEVPSKSIFILLQGR
jgi:hypothetical protein